uniref:BDBT FKBP like N-terminal domain-containing protein n=1 Tax=Clastoptera arizonana TaxID=38151 RepID=A0A1B6CQ44_9HEMI
MSLSWNCQSGSVHKDIIVHVKAAEKPKQYATCVIDVVVILGKFEGNFKSEIITNGGNTNLKINECDTELDRQIEKCVRTMSCTDKCQLTITFFESVVKFTIELISFTSEVDVFELTLEQKLELAKLHKFKGVELFKIGRDLDSFLRFSKAVKLLITVLDKENEDVKQLYITVCNNMSWCHLKKGHLTESLTLSNKVLGICPNNVKALLRRADVYDKLDDLESAANDLRQVIKLETANKIARDKLIIIEHKLRVENTKYINVVKKMFR